MESNIESSPPLIAKHESVLLSSILKSLSRFIGRELKGDSETHFYFVDYIHFLTLCKTFSMSAEYNKKLKPLARNLRKNGTKGEALLWRDVLKAKQYWPYQFNRQLIIGNYIVDFISRKLKLIIEIDGSSHFAKSEEDYKRQKFFEDHGFTILRFPEYLDVYKIDEVITEIDYVIKCIEQQIEDRFNQQKSNTNPPLVPPLK